METTVKQRLVQYLKYKKLGQNRFEKAAGLSNGYIANIKSTPGAIVLTKIFNAAPDLSRDWLLTGEGQMLAADVTPVEEKAVTPYTTNSYGVKFYEQEGGGLLMEVPVVACSALGSPADDFAVILDEYDGETATFNAERVYHGRYYAFHVEGDSMDDGTRDSFQRGDTVLVRELDRDDWAPKLHINDWPFWVVVFGNNVRLKQIVGQQGDTITLHSLNPSPEYTDFTLQLNDVVRLFNVVEVNPKPRKFKKI